MDFDFALAVSLQEEHDKERKTKITPVQNSQMNAKGIVDKEWELVDPTPNIHRLFVEYDSMFFGSSLTDNGVAVDWSKRMTLCAGVCSYQGRSGFCSIRLSQPLLKLRPRCDLVQTLLHEMIHAYLFVHNNCKDHDAHGPEFLSHMNRINDASGTRISVYHSFHQEVNQYRQHWWKCDGPCRKKPPYYGVVMRAMNRPPSPRDFWWSKHQQACGGSYVKIKEPEGYKKKETRGAKKEKERSSGSKDIRELIRSSAKPMPEKQTPDNSEGTFNIILSPPTDIFKGRGFTLGSGNPHHQDDKESDVRTKMLVAAEKRRTEREFRGSGTSHGIKRSRDDLSKEVTKAMKRSKQLDHDDDDEKKECIIITDTPISKKNSVEEAPSIIVPDSSPGPSNVIVIDESGPDTNSTRDATPLPENWFQSAEDYRTCPVCGIGNIHSSIINTHISLCLEAEELFQLIDEDD